MRNELNNLVAFDDYLAEGYNDYEIDENTDELEGDSENDFVFHDGDIYEAVAPRLTAKERKKAQELSLLFGKLNRRPAYKAAVTKFIKVLKSEAKKVVREEGMSPMVLKKMERVTLKDINNK